MYGNNNNSKMANEIINGNNEAILIMWLIIMKMVIQ
jgi:hypothetical protein